MKNHENFLSEHGIRPTAVRILVWDMVARNHETFTLADMERSMPHMDRSSIFRALRLFAEHHLLHEVNDASGVKKYCVCRCTDHHHINHIHFSCIKCGKTFCLEEYSIPLVNLPENFIINDAEYIISGVCPKCNKKA